MHQYIDIHTHKENSEKRTACEVRSISLHRQDVPNKGLISAGWHPWFLHSFSLNNIENRLNEALRNKQVIAIGECGVDRSIKQAVDQQIKLFELHVQLAIKLNKPLIIHSVKAYSDILHSLKKTKFKLPVIFHAYNGNLQLTQQLLKLNSYFSFGQNLMFNYPKIINTFSFLPSNRIFLETDESSLSIEKIYLRAAMLRNVSLQELTKQIDINFYTVFGDGLVE